MLDDISSVSFALAKLLPDEDLRSGSTAVFTLAQLNALFLMRSSGEPKSLAR